MVVQHKIGMHRVRFLREKGYKIPCVFKIGKDTCKLLYYNDILESFDHPITDRELELTKRI